MIPPLPEMAAKCPLHGHLNKFCFYSFHYVYKKQWILTLLCWTLFNPHQSIIADTCAQINPPNVILKYDENYNLTNGRYPYLASAVLKCNQGYELYGSQNDIGCYGLGYWNVPIEYFRCIPRDQGELNYKVCWI